MKTRTIVFETKFNVGDRVFGIIDGKIYRGTVEEIFIKLEQSRIDSVYTFCEKPQVQVIYKFRTVLGEFAKIDFLPEGSLASSLEEFSIIGD